MNNTLTYFGKDTALELVILATRNTSHILQNEERFCEMFNQEYTKLEELSELLYSATEKARGSYQRGDDAQFTSDAIQLGTIGGICESRLLQFVSYVALGEKNGLIEESEINSACELINKCSGLLGEVQTFVSED